MWISCRLNACKMKTKCTAVNSKAGYEYLISGSRHAQRTERGRSPSVIARTTSCANAWNSTDHLWPEIQLSCHQTEKFQTWKWKKVHHLIDPTQELIPSEVKLSTSTRNQAWSQYKSSFILDFPYISVRSFFRSCVRSMCIQKLLNYYIWCRWKKKGHRQE